MYLSCLGTAECPYEPPRFITPLSCTGEREAGHQLPDAPESEEIREVTDLDELLSLCWQCRPTNLLIWCTVNHKQAGILAWVIGSERSAETFKPFWLLVKCWQCLFYVTDGWKVYSMFIESGDQIISKTYMTRVGGENTRVAALPGTVAPKNLVLLLPQPLMLKCSLRLLLHHI